MKKEIVCLTVGSAAESCKAVLSKDDSIRMLFLNHTIAVLYIEMFSASVSFPLGTLL